MLSAWATWVAIAGASAASQSAQAAFDAASTAASENRCEEAVRAFDELARGPAAKKNQIVAAAIAVRRGNCLISLNRRDEGEASLRRGTPVLAKNPGTFAIEAREAYLTLANIAARRFDYASAIGDAKAALELSEGPARVSPLLQLAGYTRFDGDGTAIAYSGEAVQLLEGKPAVTKSELAVAHTLHARALMMADRTEDARKFLTRALSENGGLTTRANLSDIATRYDLAQVNLLMGRRDEARRYLAYTGAGRISEAPFARAEVMTLPDCGEVPGMTSDAYAVVEFSLGEDGAIERVEPIYAKGGRDAALAFAKAVHGWSWSAEAAKTIPVFYRAMTRVEMRCTNAGGRTDIMGPLDQEVAAWFEEKGQAAPPSESSAAALPALRSRAAGGDVTAFSANLALATSGLLPAEERQAAARRARELAAALRAPQQVRTSVEIARINAENASAPTNGTRQWREQRAAALRPLLGNSDIMGDPLSAATVRLALAEVMAGTRESGNAAPLIDAVADAKDLAERHPLRISALLMKANRAAASGDLTTAGAAFARTGLNEQQCALIGPRPAMTKSNTSSSQYPMEAVRMGFEGWTKIEYDIDQSGRTTSHRTLLAYPPFVFGDAAQAMLSTARFEPSYRPQTGLACSANQTSVQFKMP